ncbi:hypothetical protein N9878_02755 [bacterium]|nr:hypothetical protein [bacterium]
MKNLHFLSKQIGLLMLFLASPAGAGLTLIIAFCFDLSLNSFGINEYFSTKIVESLAKLHVTAWGGYMVAIVFSAFASIALGLSIIMASFHGYKGTAFGLSALSVFITSVGLSSIIDAQSFSALFTFTNITKICMIIGMALIPVLVYNMNSRFVLGQFGAVMKAFNSESLANMNESLMKQMKSFGVLDVEKANIDNEKKLAKLQKGKANKIKPETVGGKSYEEMIKELGL